jgi:hypothetical protein
MDGNTSLQAAYVATMNQETKPRGPLAQALKQVEEYQELCRQCAQQLDDAASVRAGLMDSDSRRAEVQRQIQSTLAHVAQRLRKVP